MVHIHMHAYDHNQLLSNYTLYPHYKHADYITEREREREREMERSLGCHKLSCLAVKCTALLAIVTLLHTLFVLNGQSTKLSHYFTFNARHCCEEESHAIMDDTGQRSNSQYHLRFPDEREEEEERGDHEYSNTDEYLGWANSTRHSDTLKETFIPKWTFSQLGESDVSTVEKFVFFVGYSRSGHSIVASLLDAHPNIIIAHEYNLFRKWKGSRYHNRSFLYNELYQNSYNNAEKGWRSSVKDQKGYTLAMKDSWQGSFQKLLVIGEKSGAVTTQAHDNDPLLFLQMLTELQATVRVPMRVIHVVRNPYDMISTRLLYAEGESRKYKVHATEKDKYVSPGGLGQQVNRTIHLVDNVRELLSNCSLTYLDVHLADLIRDPEHAMSNLCMFVGVDCSEDYLRKCSDKVYRREAETRKMVEWPPELIDKVYQMIIKPHQPFWRYSFTSS